jgi:hypothetical protein
MDPPIAIHTVGPKTLSKDIQFINEIQQRELNNIYDYQITQMFRIFLKSDATFNLPKEKKTHEINKYFNECENIITMFK